MAFRSLDPSMLEWHNVSVELAHEGVPTGRLRSPVAADIDGRDSTPALLAHRPQAWRFFRLARILGAARALALVEFGPAGPGLLNAACVSILDSKGDFGVVWRASEHRPALEAIVARALALEGEDPQDQLGHFDESRIVPDCSHPRGNLDTEDG